MVGVPDEEAGELPKAFIVPADDATDDEYRVRLRARLPAEAGAPIERIDEIPKSPSGKILRRVLAERES